MDDLDTISHNDPARPAFGYHASDGLDLLDRALKAEERAEWRASRRARRIAEFVILDVAPVDFDVKEYAKAKAAEQYAAAVYTATAEQVRAA